ncbi:unnamed protein product [Mycena citricolor]|uniref:Uncharacterized protein n=1 Tax=Mycena citricolor TaxID=2018698 RepID=A0AAD2GYY3_9AGAR|nr:unnamed protein product [Mycena citricolor]
MVMARPADFSRSKAILACYCIQFGGIWCLMRRKQLGRSEHSMRLGVFKQCAGGTAPLPSRAPADLILPRAAFRYLSFPHHRWTTLPHSTLPPAGTLLARAQPRLRIRLGTRTARTMPRTEAA